MFKRVVLILIVLGLLLSESMTGASRVAANTFKGDPSSALISNGTDPLRLYHDSNGITLELRLPDYHITEIQREGETFHQIVVASEDWVQSNTPGAPQIPERNLLLAVPATGNIALEVLDAQWQEVAGTFHLQSAAQYGLDAAGDQEEQSLKATWDLDPAIYNQSRWTPQKSAEITREGHWRGFRYAGLALRPFQFNPVEGKVRALSTLTVRLSFSMPQPFEIDEPAADPLFDPILAATFANFDQALQWRSQTVSPISVPGIHRGSGAGGPWVKIMVDSDGLYRVTYGDLVDAGISNLTLDSLNPQTFRLYDDSLEQDISVLGQGDASFDPVDEILFYGGRNREKLSSDDNVYWLTWDGQAGHRMLEVSGTPQSAAPANTLLTTLHVEDNTLYKQQRPFIGWLEPMVYDHWYWQHVEISKTISMDNLAVDTSSPLSATLSVWMAGDRRDAGNYIVDFEVNGQDAGSMAWSSTKVLTGTHAIPVGSLTDGSNDLWLAPRILGFPAWEYTVWLDWVKLTYPYDGRYLPGSPFGNPTPGTWLYQLTDVPESAPWILNLASADQPQKILGAQAVPADSGFTLSWQVTSAAEDRFLVVPPAEIRSPGDIQVYSDAGLLNPDQQVDYLMISHGDLIGSAQPLADQHSASGLSVALIDVQAIYDIFSDGSVSAEAIRDFLGYAYDNYQWPPPAAALLIGDGTVDFRGYQFASYGHANLIPPYMGGFDFWGGATPSDNAYVWLEGDDVLGEMLISRLPVNNPAQANVVVDKILNYPSSFPAGRALSTFWVADNPDSENPLHGTQFHLASEETLAELAPEFQVDRAYFCDPAVNTCTGDSWIYTDVPTIRTAIQEGISEGHAFLHFSGHGSIGTWAVEAIFRKGYVSQLSNGDALPFMLISSCTNGYFADARWDGLDETMLRTEDKGTVGGFAGTTFDTLTPQTAVSKYFLRAVMNDGITQPGPASAVARAKTYVQFPGNEGEFTAVGHNLSGDPLLYLISPESCIEGDLDCDGDIDIVDVQRVAAVWNSTAWQPGFNPRADLVRDGRITVEDMAAISALWQTTFRRPQTTFRRPQTTFRRPQTTFRRPQTTDGRPLPEDGGQRE